jgi:Xaa-Pro aminopeptidase
VTAAAAVAGGEKALNAFETLTLAPIDRRLIAPALLTPDELGWLNAYHTQVRETLAPLLDQAAAAWLTTATAPIKV